MAAKCKYGSHRSLHPVNALPQRAWKLNNDMETIYDNEILVDVDILNIDSASFRQIMDRAAGEKREIAKIICGIVSKRGKLHNPVTGSGGMFTGRVRRIGSSIREKADLEIGDRIVSLVSLSLTPLRIEEIIDVRPEIEQVEVVARAILFEKTSYHKLSEGKNERLLTALLDVAGAPAQINRIVKRQDVVVIIGAGGKSGMLCSCVAREKAGENGIIIGIARSAKSIDRARKVGCYNYVMNLDATNALQLSSEVCRITNGQMADCTVNCANARNTELGSILATKETGIVYFFNMATDFTSAALGAEGIAHDVTMIIGNGYVKDHAKIAMKTFEENNNLKVIFEDLYGPIDGQNRKPLMGE